MKYPVLATWVAAAAAPSTEQVPLEAGESTVSVVPERLKVPLVQLHYTEVDPLVPEMDALVTDPAPGVVQAESMNVPVEFW